MAGHHRAEHHLLGELLGLRLDHQHGILRAGHDKVERRGLDLVDRRVELQLAVDHADAGGADRPHEGDARQRQRGRGRDHRQDVGVVLEVVRQHGDDDLRVVAVAFREKRADRPVDQAGNQRFLLRGAPFALEIAARDAPGGEGLFLVVDGEGEEVLARLRLLQPDHGGEHGGLAVAGEHGAVGLAGDLAGFEHELAPGPIDDFAMNVEHYVSFLRWRGPGGASPQQDGEALCEVRGGRHGAAEPAAAARPRGPDRGRGPPWGLARVDSAWQSCHGTFALRGTQVSGREPRRRPAPCRRPLTGATHKAARTGAPEGAPAVLWHKSAATGSHAERCPIAVN